MNPLSLTGNLSVNPSLLLWNLPIKQKKERKEMVNRLPTDIVLDIITRLPTESILDCKLVCRSWRNLVSHHPSFAQMHLARLHGHDSGKLSFLAVVYKGRTLENLLHYFEYNENTDHETTIHNTRRMNSTLPFPFRFSHFRIMGSFNGLVCLFGWQDNVYFICNPMTKEYVMFPNYISDKFSTRGKGFGYLNSTNEYKVVEFYEELNFIKAAVYTLGSGKGWRNVGQWDSMLCNVKSSCGAFANGAIYWMDCKERKLFVFDLVEEKFREHVALPPHPQLGSHYTPLCFIGDLGGVLYYYAGTFYNEITNFRSYEIWLLKKKNNIPVMKKQVEHEPFGWSKFSLPQSKHPFASTTYPLTFTKSGSVLSYCQYTLDIYNAVASTSKQLVGFAGTGIILCNIVPHKNTFISLKELGEEDVKTMESAEIEEAKAVT